MDKYKLNLDSVFSPQSIAFIGASSSFAKWGQMILSNTLASMVTHQRFRAGC